MVFDDLSDPSSNMTLCGLQGGASEITCQCRVTRDIGFDPGSGKRSPWSREMATALVMLVWKIPLASDPDGLQSMRSQKNWT